MRLGCVVCADHSCKAFRSGNVDLPANQSHTANPANITLPDALTELDLIGPGLDPSFLLSQPLDGDFNAPDPGLFDLGSSQQLSSSIERGRAESRELEDDIGLDLDLDVSPGPITPSKRKERDIEVGRDAQAARSELGDQDDTTLQLLQDDGIGHDLDIGDIGTDKRPVLGPGRDSLNLNVAIGMDDDLLMAGVDDELGLPPIEDGTNTNPRKRDSESPLSSIRESQEREVERTVFLNRQSDAYEPEEESVHQPQRVKRRKVLHADQDTMIHAREIRAQQEDRSKILKPAAFLPKDPMLLALMEMQKNGGFVSNILGDERSKGWAPELRGVLSLEVIRGPGEHKRKRDSGVAGVDTQEGQEEPQLEYDVNEELALPTHNLEQEGDTSIHANDDIINIPADDGDLGQIGDEDQAEPGSDPMGLPEDFDQTEMPAIHPADSGPVSLGTKHAVHLLRDRFGAGAAESPSKRQKSSVLFQELLPERTTSRADATKMFFEVLVLATKDAIKVEQRENELGGPLRVRGKRGLWGSWAEMEAGGEIAEQAQQTAHVA